MRFLWISVFFLVISPLVFVACAPQRLFDAFHPSFRSEEDCGYVQNVYGERISWKGNLPIQLSVHQSFPAEMLPALYKAIDQWETADGHKVFQVVDTSLQGPLEPRQDGQNIIYWFTDSWEEDRPLEQARTSVYWIGDEIHEADIRINAKNFSFYLDVPQNATQVHLESLLIHELGHVLGLKHTDTGQSVMATYLASVTVRTKIAQIDMKDLRCEYQ